MNGSQTSQIQDNYNLLVSVMALLLIVACPIAAQSHEWETLDYINGVNYRDVEFADSLHGMAAGNWAEPAGPIIRRTRDGGQTWDSALVFRTERDDKGNFIKHPVPFYAVAHPTPDIAIVVADSGMMFRSYNGGNSWDTLDFDFVERFRDISMNDAFNGVASSESNKVFHTVDGGKTWETFQARQNITLWDIAYVDEHECKWQVFISDGTGFGIAKLNLANGAWTTYQTPLQRESWQLQFIDPLHGWLVGFDVTIGQSGNDRIFETTDGGESWTSSLEKRIDPPFGLICVDFADELHGIAGGRQAKILRTNDGGKNWIVDNAGIPETIFATTRITHVNRDLAFAVTQDGYILRYDTRTTSFDEGASPQEDNFSLVYPNPANQHITVSAPWLCADKHIELFDLTGRLVLATSGEASSEQSIDISTLLPGVYHVRISGCEKSASRQIVVAR